MDYKISGKLCLSYINTWAKKYFLIPPTKIIQFKGIEEVAALLVTKRIGPFAQFDPCFSVIYIIWVTGQGDLAYRAVLSPKQVCNDYVRLDDAYISDDLAVIKYLDVADPETVCAEPAITFELTVSAVNLSYGEISIRRSEPDVK